MRRRGPDLEALSSAFAFVDEDFIPLRLGKPKSQILLRVFGKADGSTKTSHAALDGKCEDIFVEKFETSCRKFGSLNRKSETSN